MTDSVFADLVQQAEQRIGTTLKAKWRIDRLIGVGGMASVYAATHRNNKRVAIKMLHPTLSMLRTVRERFQREGYVANSVGHSGAVSVDDDDLTEDGCAFLVMELLEGETLEARRIRLGGALPAEEVLGAMEQVLATLAAAHEKGIVHRDLKPDNLFLTRGGEAKVLDFGIARLRDLALATGHTHTANLMGTPAFMPPEQARARWDEVDGQSDLWAVGATMFTLLSGQPVHQASTIVELLITAATTPAPSLGATLLSLPPSVVQLVDRALAFQKSERWADAASMRTAVRKALVLLDEPSAQVAGGEPIPPFLPRAEPAAEADWTDEPTTAAPSLDRAAAAEPERKPFPAASERAAEVVPPRWPSSLDQALAGERVTTTPGVERVLPKRVPSSSLAWAAAMFLALGIVLAVVFLSHRNSTADRAPASNASVQASATEATAHAPREPRVTLESSLPRVIPVRDLPVPAPAPKAAVPWPGTSEPKPAETAAGASAAHPASVVRPNSPEPVDSGFVHRAPPARRQLDDGGLLDNPYQ